MSPESGSDENLNLEDTLADIASLIATTDSFVVKKLARDALAAPWNFTVIGIFFPKQDLTPEEMDTLVEYVKNGGGLLVTGERGDEDQRTLKLNELIERFGMKFKPDRIFDPIHSYAGDQAEQAHPEHGKKKDFVKINKFAEHAMTLGIKEVAYFEGCSLDLPMDKQLAWSDSMSFADENADGAWSVGEKIGSLPIAGYTTMEKGRIVAVGDTSLFTRRTMKMADNRKFCHNIVKWLARGKVAQTKVSDRVLTPVG